MEDGKQILDEKQLFLGDGSHRFAGAQPREQMSVVAGTQFLRLARVQDVHLFTLEPRRERLWLHVTLSVPGLIFRAELWLHRQRQKVRKIQRTAPKNAVYKMS